MKRCSILVISCVLLTSGMLTGLIVEEGQAASKPWYSWYPNVVLPSGVLTVNITDGDDSYFDVIFEDIPTGPGHSYDIQNGVAYRGWCVEFGVTMTRDRSHPMTAYHSYDPNLPNEYNDVNWSTINYILNSNFNWIDAAEMQEHIWYHTDDIDPDSTTAQSLIDQFSLEGVNYVPNNGNIIAVLLQFTDPDDTHAYTVQDIIIEVPLTYDGHCPHYWRFSTGEWEDFSTSDTVGMYFDVPSFYNELEDYTFHQILQGLGTGLILSEDYEALLQEAIAGLLNANKTGVSYPLNQDQILSSVNTALNNYFDVIHLERILTYYNILSGDICE